MSRYGSTATEYRTVQEGIAAFYIDRDVTLVYSEKADVAADYLHSQMSQDITSMANGESRWSFLLQPHGKVDALVRVTRLDAEDFVLDCDPGFGALVRERLNRFKLRTKVDFERLDWKALALRSARPFDAPSADDVSSHELERAAKTGESSFRTDVRAGVVAEAKWPGLYGYDLLGARPEMPEGSTLCSSDTYELLRVESGFPQMGREMDEKTIPAEAGLNDLAISFQKGCYTGQELVARIDARGNHLPRHLRTVLIANTDEVPPVGSRVLTSGPASKAKVVGALTSVAHSPTREGVVALAMVKREVQPGSEVFVEFDEFPIAARVEKAPLAS